MKKLSEKGQFSVLGIKAGPNLTSDPASEAVGLPAFLLIATAAYKYYWWEMEANCAPMYFSERLLALFRRAGFLG